MATYDLGTARGRIEIDASTIGRTSSALTSLGKGMIGLGAVAVAGFALAVGAAAGFETQLSRFKAVTGSSKADMEALRAKALQLGRDSAFGATEVIKAFVELGKAGLSAKDVLKGVGDAAVFLAAAGEIDMTESTKILVNALRTFKLPATEAVHVANLLAGAANASTSEVDDLAVSMRYAGPVAAAAGINISDLSTVLAIFANVGIKGSTAGTTLRGIILGIAASTPKATNEMKALGIITKDGANILFDAQGKIKPLGEVFQILKEKTAGLSAQQRIAAFNAIFQRRAIAGAVEAAVQGKKGFDDMKKAIGNVTAEQVMKTKLDNLQGSFRLLVSSIQTLLISAGSPLQKTLKGWVDNLREVVNAIDKMDPATLGLIVNILGVVGAFLIVAGSVTFMAGKFIAAIRIWKDAVAGIRLVSAALGEMDAAILANPIGLLVAALVIAVAIIILVATHWDQTWTAIKNNPAIAAIVAILSPFIITLVLLGFIIHEVADNWRQAWSDIKSFVGQIIPTITGLISDLWNGLSSGASDAFNALKDAVSSAFTEIQSNVVDAATALGEAAVTAFTAFISFMDKLPEHVGYAIGFILGFFVSLPIKIQELLGLVIPVLAEWVAQAVVWAVQFGVQFYLNAITFLLNLPGALWGIFLSALSTIGNFLAQAIPKAAQLGIQFVNNVLIFLASLPGRMAGVFLQVLSAIGNFILTAIGNAAHFGSQFVSAVTDGLGKLPGFVGGILGKVIEAIKSKITEAFNAVKSFASGLWEGFKKGLFGSPRTKIEYAVEAMTETVDKSIKDLRGQLGQLQRLGVSLKPVDDVINAKLTPVGAGVVTAAAAPASPVTVQAGDTHGDTVQIETHTDADPDEIVNAYFFGKKVRG